MKGKRRKERVARKRAAKLARYGRGASGESRYARKKSGQLEPTPQFRRVWCDGCYCKMCRCSALQIEDTRKRKLEANQKRKLEANQKGD